MEYDYPPPLDQLLKLDKPAFGPWLDYPGELGIGEEHLAGLIRMVGDTRFDECPEDAPEVWAPLHAWRALGQLGDEAAIEPLMSLLPGLDVDNWAWSDLPLVFAAIGRASVPPLIRYLEEKERGANRAVAVEALVEVVRAEATAHGAVVPALAAQLEDPGSVDEVFNAKIIDALIKLDAVEAAPAIERAFAEERVDEWITGDWEDVQIALGLLEKRITPEPPLPAFDIAAAARALAETEDEPFRIRRFTAAPAQGKSELKPKSQKARRKAAKQSRRKNRRR